MVLHRSKKTNINKNMTTEMETAIDKDIFWNLHDISEEALDELKQQINETPIVPRTTKVMRIEYNIRPTEETSSNTSYETGVTECKIGSSEDEMLMFNGITLPECCLMQYDHSGISPITGENIYYDLAIVRTSKPKSYWMEHFS
jgi:hypothetical protein